MTWVVPGAIVDYVRNRSTPVRDKTLGLILHVQAGTGALDGWFNNPAAQASSTWQARKTGEIRQFGDPDQDKMWAQAAGNTDYASVETEGQPSEPLTPEQIEAVAQIYAEGSKQEGWPFQLAEKPGDRGLGWHGMGGAAWGGHTGCPGDIRKAQRAAILARAQQIAQGDDVSAADVWTTPMGNNPGDATKPSDAANSLQIARNYAYLAYGKSLAIETALKALAAGIGPAVEKAVADALAADYTVSLSQKQG
jgi:hypothetical protein